MNATGAPPDGPTPAVTHHRVTVEVADPPGAELVADRLWQLGTLGIEERPGLLIAVFDDPTTAAAAAAEFGSPAPEPVDAVAVVDAVRWRARPVRVGRVLIRPPWVDPPPPPSAIDGTGPPAPAGDDATATIEVVIDPGRAFGSGSHPSTRLAVALLDELVRPGGRVLDVGTGTGVLAVLAGHLGATVTACDVDPPAVATSRDNVRRNHLSGRVAVTDRPVAELDGEYDIVVANLTIDVHEHLASDLDRLAGSGGVLVASGILEGRQVDRLLASHPGRVLARHRREGDWAGVVLAPATGPPTPGPSPHRL